MQGVGDGCPIPDVADFRFTKVFTLQKTETRKSMDLAGSGRALTPTTQKGA